MNTRSSEWQSWWAWRPVVRHHADRSEWIWLERIYRYRNRQNQWIYRTDLFELIQDLSLE